MNDMRQMTALGRSIEDSSFAIIDAEAGAHDFDARQWQVVRRVIHATADFEFKTLMQLSPDAVAAGHRRRCAAAARSSCDVKMIIAGLNEERLRGLRLHEPVLHQRRGRHRRRPRRRNSTRAIEAMRKAHRLGLLDGAIVAVGNAPTALLETARLVARGGRAAGAHHRRAGRLRLGGGIEGGGARRRRRRRSWPAAARAARPSPWPSSTRCCSCRRKPAS